MRTGRISQAANRLRAVIVNDIPRPLARTFANLFRRAQLETFSLRLLTPIVRTNNLHQPATPEEIAEHAAALQEIGAVQEAVDLLQPLDPAQAPDSLLFLSFCHFQRWEYAQAVPLLRRYIESATDDYSRMVGMMNLAAAYAVEHDFFPSLNLSQKILEHAQAEGRLNLKTKVHELRAQIYIAQNKYSEAREELRFARQPFAGKIAKPNDLFFVRKWEAVLDSFESQTTHAIAAFRLEAEERKDWESLREADYLSLKIQFDNEKFQHLMFGTPFASYRERVLKGLGQKWEQDHFVFGPQAAPSFVLLTAEFENLQAEAPSKMVHQVLATLLRDFYKPWSIGALFCELFPGEYFDIFSSPNRVHQLLWRLRKWTETNSLPAQLHENSGNYSLKMSAAFSFKVPREGMRVDENVLQLRQLQSKFKDKPSFTPREAQACLNISASSFKRLAQWGLKAQKLRREGASRATIYKLVG